ncbi:hypothetical protein J6590_032649 [Homalodisca vitripennis]|nr:hypothetical protein J6590_032649 [Homalodisca vitripennis]
MPNEHNSRFKGQACDSVGLQTLHHLETLLLLKEGELELNATFTYCVGVGTMTKSRFDLGGWSEASTAVVDRDPPQSPPVVIALVTFYSTFLTLAALTTTTCGGTVLPIYYKLSL